jgi:hypothetical protein
MNAPSSSAKKPHLASTAGQGYFIFTAEGERRTGRREVIDEDGATPRHLSLRPSEQREQAAALERSRSGGEDLDHRLRYRASAQNGGNSHKLPEKAIDLHLIYSGALPRPTPAS